MKVAAFYVYVPGDDWAPQRRTFLESYKTFRAGMKHELVMLVKADTLPDPLEDITATWLAVGEHGYDIGPFLDMVRLSYMHYDRVVLLGAYSRILARDWLKKLCNHGELTSATGSYEVRPHLRTNAIAMHPRLLTQMPTSVTSKQECWQFEHGPNSLFRTAEAQGVYGEVVGKDNRAYLEPDWPGSYCYRAGDQANLLVADNHTERYALADDYTRQLLSKVAWNGQATFQAVNMIPRVASVTVLTVTIPGRSESLSRCIESVFNQTLKVQRHLVLAHAAADPPSKAMPEYSHAKNLLLESVDTEWIAVLNDDDLWMPNHMATVWPASHEADVVYSWDAGLTRPRVDVTNWSKEKLVKQTREGNVVDGNALIRTSVLRSVGGFPTEWVGRGPREGGHFINSPAMFEDQELWLRMLTEGNPRFKCVPQETWRYSIDTPGRIGGAA